MRTLRLTSPNMKGDDIKRVQGRLAKTEYSRGLTVDGVYGPATGEAVRAWKYRMGFPKSDVNTGLGEYAQHVLFGRIEKLPVDYRARRLARMAKGFVPGWGLPKEPKIYVGEKAADIMVAWANQGLKESPSGSNKVPALQEFARAQGLAFYYVNMGWPWCEFSVNLAGLGAGSKTSEEGLRKGKWNALYTMDAVSKADSNLFGMRRVSSGQAVKGDRVYFNFPGGEPTDHVGLFLEWTNRDTGWFRSVEGNTSGTLGGSQSNGGGVYIRDRHMSQTSAFIRWS